MNTQQAFTIEAIVESRPDLANQAQKKIAAENAEMARHHCRTINAADTHCENLNKGVRGACAECLRRTFHGA